MGNLWTIIFYRIIIRLMLNIFWKTLYNKKDTKFGSQNFGYQIWFCTRLYSDKCIAATVTWYNMYFVRAADSLRDF